MAAPFIRTVGIHLLVHENPGPPKGRAERTPISNALGLLLTCVEHGHDNHEPGRDRALANSQEEAAHEELSERLCRGVTEQGDRPHEDVDTRCAAGSLSASAELSRAGARLTSSICRPEGTAARGFAATRTRGRTDKTQFQAN